jgi:OOP family OmpA-OmpF porin
MKGRTDVNIKAVATAAALVALPLATQAQSLQYPGFYIGAEGGGTWMFQTSSGTPFGSGTIYPALGWAAGGMIGYDFVGPRIELEGIYRYNQATVGAGSFNAFGASKDDVGVLANILYDFNAGGRIVPYIGAGAGVAVVRTSALGAVNESARFAYQAIVGVGYNIDPQFRVNLDARYYGTTSPWLIGGNTYNNNNISLMASLQVKFGAPTVAPPPPAPPPAQINSFMVFFDWDRSNLSQQAMATIQQAANAFKTTGNARITATGHADRSGPENYNMALSLRRANAVKDALVQNGVPATAISVVGKGESQPLVPTADGVREPQNRRVEIVIQ